MFYFGIINIYAAHYNSFADYYYRFHVNEKIRRRWYYNIVRYYKSYFQIFCSIQQREKPEFKVNIGLNFPIISGGKTELMDIMSNMLTARDADIEMQKKRGTFRGDDYTNIFYYEFHNIRAVFLSPEYIRNYDKLALKYRKIYYELQNIFFCYNDYGPCYYRIQSSHSNRVAVAYFHSKNYAAKLIHRCNCYPHIYTDRKIDIEQDYKFRFGPHLSTCKRDLLSHANQECFANMPYSTFECVFKFDVKNWKDCGSATMGKMHIVNKNSAVQNAVMGQFEFTGAEKGVYYDYNNDYYDNLTTRSPTFYAADFLD